MAETETTDLPIACLLPDDARQVRGEALVAPLFAAVQRTEELADGYAFAFPPGGEWIARLGEFIAVEAVDERPTGAPLTLVPAARAARNRNIRLDAEAVTLQRKPEWLRPQTKWTEEHSPNYHDVRQLMRQHNLHTVCEEARCPNIS